ncbi:paraquat-inducible protein A [Sulfitobacter sp. F26169L]|uniref:paraquat-inducible protein A n=1 Tax=Sulfitobacter sp. F26169L TaxID=2996015 RepID=UPI002260CF0D|nr:paraquat-inducible protein A [Sulfitobacter sp. F26169L]MCX7566594.1 paraquat-inducible protein A [Sulfitobacter sp. F26169L]
MEFTGIPQKTVTAREAGLVACTRCNRAWPLGTDVCRRCGKTLVSRDVFSLQKVWALWLVGLMCYVPANMYPMLRTQQLFTVDESTIIGGAVDLAHYGAFGIAAVILVASVVIPLGKFWAIAFLAVSVRSKGTFASGKRLLMYEIVEYIGRWSMIDIFVVAILSALVQLQGLASITPGPAAFFFALSVIFTMLSAQAFDPRMIWDAQSEDDKAFENV